MKLTMKSVLFLALTLSGALAIAQAGTIDPDFHSSGTEKEITSIVEQQDKKVLIAGEFLSYYGDSARYITRLNPDGSHDLPFNYKGFGPDAPVIQMKLQKNEKIIIIGTFAKYNGQVASKIARLNTDGTLDTSFKAADIGQYSVLYDMEIQPDDKILLIGYFVKNIKGYIDEKNILRLNKDGSVDSSFVAHGVGTGYYSVLALQKNGKIVLGGMLVIDDLEYTRPCVLRLNSDGTSDNTFDTAVANGRIFVIAVQSDQKILVGGEFTKYDDHVLSGLIRVESNGDIDTGFNTSVSDVAAVAFQSDGKILVGGFYSLGDFYSTVSRLNTDGSRDDSFDSGEGTNKSPSVICVQKDGKILLAGYFVIYKDLPKNRLVRLIGETKNNVNEVNKSVGFNLYPNPSSGFFTLNTDKLVFNISVFDSGGRLIKKGFTEGNSIDLSDFSDGMYFVEVSCEEGVEVVKMIVQH
ncbi:MAG: T9SS type A sorting domain-containing protein [Bacteroidetes bacterium]|nr:T9SS type A sorting domain-containing protein [Bacteroidota bacterium]